MKILFIASVDQLSASLGKSKTEKKAGMESVIDPKFYPLLKEEGTFECYILK